MTSGTHAATRTRGARRRATGGARRAVSPGRVVRQRRGCRLLAVGLVAVAALLLLNAAEVRAAEAWFQGVLLGAIGVESHLFGTVVLVNLDGRLAGISLTTGCSIGPMLAVFLLACAPLLWYRSMPLLRVVLATTQLAAALVLVNETRIAAIVLSMRHWGFERGYDVAHVFLGSAISTAGFVVGAVLFVRMFGFRSAVVMR